jgi:aminopeptidase N
MRSCRLLALLSLLLASAAGAAELPRTVAPTHYRIELRPDLDRLTFAGSETVEITASAPTDRLMLNAVALDPSRATVDGEPASLSLDAAAETATLVLRHPIAAGTHQLAIDFIGKINNFGRGLFKVDYPTDDGSKRMIATHLEPADARRIFPSWDAPAFKASFETAIVIPEGFLAVSNMPAVAETSAGPGLKRVAFAATPPMSSYLFVLVAGDLDRITGQSDGVEIGVVTTKGKSETGRYALSSAIDLLHYYDDYFGIPYGLPKLDLIAVPGLISGAMENWGGITFFESRLLYNPGYSSERLKRDNYTILAHEMSHQWFGNLVTMAWWDDLWLNEGFATWMQAKATEELNPSWPIWLDEAGLRETAINADARRSTHPIQQPVTDESEALSAFDVITYVKGRSFIRQLENYLGADRFRAGIRLYLADHLYGNATTADLWRSLAAASAEPVAAIASSYTEQGGVPLIRVAASCADGRQRLHLAQERFAVHDPGAAPRQWRIPIAYAAVGGETKRLLLAGTEADIDAAPCDPPIKLNPDGVGYYRVQYDHDAWRALIDRFGSLSPSDKVNLIADAAALAGTGRMTPDDFLDAVEAARPSDTRAVWQAVERALGRFEFLARGRPAHSAVSAYASAVLRPAFAALGWDPASNEDPDRMMLRADLIWSLGEWDDPDIRAETARRFAAYRGDRASLAADLRPAVLHLAGRYADRTTWEAIHAMARAATVSEDRVRFYYALASARDPALAGDTLAIALGDELPSNLDIALINWVASAGQRPELAWQFTQDNFAVLSDRFGPTYKDTGPAAVATNFTDTEHAAELAQFAPAHETAGGRIVADRAEESILADADEIATVLPAIEAAIAQRLGKAGRP